MKPILFTAALALGLTACSPAPAGPDISVHDTLLRLPLPGQTTAAGYFTITNAGSPDMLIAVSSPAGDPTEMHAILSEDGVMKMRRIDAIPVPTGDTELKPGGLHIMIFNTDLAPGTASIPLTLEFESSGQMTINLNSDEDGGEKPDMDHSGH